MIATKEFKPELRSSDFPSILVLSRPTARLTSCVGDIIDSPLTDDHAKEICDQLTCKSSEDLREKLTVHGWTETTLAYAHSLALQYMESQLLAECQIRSEFASVFLVLEDLSRRGSRYSTPSVQLINPDDRQTLTLFHRPGLPGENKYPGVVQVFCQQTWCGQIRRSNSKSSASTCFCRTTFCPEWIEGLLLDFAANPSLLMQRYQQLTGKHSLF